MAPGSSPTHPPLSLLPPSLLSLSTPPSVSGQGLGAIRPINRRYISECVALNVRTVASAAFVAAGALGTCAMPWYGPYPVAPIH